jgi:hypothetical protein
MTGLGAVFSVSASEPSDWAFVIPFTAITFGSLETSKWIISRRRQRNRLERLKFRAM